MITGVSDITRKIMMTVGGWRFSDSLQELLVYFFNRMFNTYLFVFVLVRGSFVFSQY